MCVMVVETGERVDGRAADEIRPIMVKPDYLPLVHGSGLFQRGQTQVLSICTLGMLNEWQRLDTIEPVDGKRYIHHYNFSPFCTVHRVRDELRADIRTREVVVEVVAVDACSCGRQSNR